jgi:hypothetical protein
LAALATSSPKSRKQKSFVAATRRWRILNCSNPGTARSSARASGFMSFVLKRLPLADQDALAAAIWYEERQSGLGEDFLDEVDRAGRALAHDALLYRIRFADVRRAPVHRFRYYGIY